MDRESQSDISTILISYLAMFAYVTVTLGKYTVFSKNNNRSMSVCRRIIGVFETLMVDMKFTLGLAGVFIVIMSVTTSIGMFSYFGVKATLIIFEVN